MAPRQKTPGELAADVLTRLHGVRARQGQHAVAQYLGMPAEDLDRALDPETIEHVAACRARALTDHEAARRLTRLIERHGSLRRAAKALNVSKSLLGLMSNRKRAIGPKLLKALRLRKVVVFEEIPPRITRHRAR
jgi:hypothetical protein